MFPEERESLPCWNSVPAVILKGRTPQFWWKEVQKPLGDPESCLIKKESYEHKNMKLSNYVAIQIQEKNVSCHWPGVIFRSRLIQPAQRVNWNRVTTGSASQLHLLFWEEPIRLQKQCTLGALSWVCLSFDPLVWFDTPFFFFSLCLLTSESLNQNGENYEGWISSS